METHPDSFLFVKSGPVTNELNYSYVFGFIKPEANKKTQEIFKYFKLKNFELIYSKRELLKKEQALSYYARDDGWKSSVGSYALYSNDIRHKHSKEECVSQGEIILERMIKHMLSDEVVLFIFRLSSKFGDAINIANQLIGHTDPTKALPGTIRWDLFHSDKLLSSIKDEDGFIYNLIDLCKKSENMVEAIVSLIPEKDLRKYRFLSHIEV